MSYCLCEVKLPRRMIIDKDVVRSEPGLPSPLMQTFRVSAGQSDGPDLFGLRQRVLGVRVLPQGRRQKEAAESV